MRMRSKKCRPSFDQGCDAFVELLECRQLLSGSPQLSVTTSAVNNAVAFNTVAQGNSGAAPSRIETATITNSGSAPLTFGAGAFSIVNDPSTTAAASDFAITNSGSLPSSLAPGGSFTIQLQYTATAIGLQSALLQIQSNDPTNPTFDVNLHGIGTPGQFGTLEPSLVQVLLAQNIPTIVGAGPNDVNVNTQAYPLNPDPSSQEVPMQRLVAADPLEAVSITPIASFSAATAAVSRIGYYAPGNPSGMTELFYIGQGDAQTVDPTALGASSFNPGSAPFGLYGEFPGTTIPSGQLDVHYSEDALNTGSTDGMRKIRFFPMKSANGTIVPNTFVFAIEDYDSSTYNSFINFVGIISNVRAAPDATMGSVPSNTAADNPPVMGIDLNQTSPGSTTLVFNDLSVPNAISPDVTHNTQSITINNTGDQPLVINSLTLSDTTNWELVSPPAAGTSIAAGSSLNVTIKFIANSDPPHVGNQTNDITSFSGVPSDQAGGVWSGTLTINSNDPVNATQTVNLAGYWQYQTEHENEPGVNTLTNLLWGYDISDVGSASTQGTEFPNNGNTPVTYGSEVDPSTDQGLLVAADPTQPVSLVELAAFHSQYATEKAWVTTNGTADEVDINTLSETGSTVTATVFTAETFSVGQTVNIESVDPFGYDGAFTITSTPDSSTFTFTDSPGLGPTTPLVTQAQAGWYAAGNSGNSVLLYEDQPNNGQSLYPLLSPDSLSTVQTQFNPTGEFGLNLDGMMSQDSQNSQDLQYDSSEHALRFWPVTQANGDIVPNAWIVGLDYRNYVGPNSDYQDLFMLLTNATFEAMPAAPIDLQASPGTSGVNLQWTPVTGAAGYNVMASVNGGAFAKLNSSLITASNYVDTTAASGADIQYQVVAVTSDGTASLPASASVNLSSTPAPPAAPAFVQADGSSGTQVALSWTAPTSATGYNLQREGPDQNTFTTIASDLTNTSYVDTNVMPGETYEYQIQALNAAGTSPFSAPATVTVAQQTLGAPTNVQITADTASGVTMTWAASTGATSYEILRKGPGENSFASIAGGVQATTFTDAAIIAGQTYIYEIVAIDATGSSPASSPVTAAVPAASATLSITIGKGADAFVRFTAANGALVNVSLEGSGTATMNFVADSISQSASGKGVILTGSNVTIAGITVSGTTSGSSLLINVRGAGKTINLGALTINTPIGAVVAPGVILVDSLTASSAINRITLNAAVGATIGVDGNLGRFTARSDDGAALSVTGSINSITANSWFSNQAIAASSIGAITIRGTAQLDVTAGSLRTAHISGAMNNSTITLTAAGALDLANLSAGSIFDSEIDTAANIGLISAAALTNSQIYAGVGSGANATFPPITSAFAGQASIAAVSLRLSKNAFSDTNSTIAASQIERLNLSRVQFTNGGVPFGVEAVSVKMLSASGPQTKPFTIRNLTSQATVSADFAAKKINPGDFEIVFPSQYSGS